MKKLTTVLLTMTLTMGMPIIAVAMNHSSHGAEKSQEMKNHGDTEHADEGMHKGHDMKMDKGHGMAHDMKADGDDGFVEIGKDTQKGVVAKVKIKTYDAETLATMQKMGMDATHHIMIFFTDEKSGADITGGKIALKVQGTEMKPAMLMQMGNGFGGDVSLKGGMQSFEIGTKLEDGEKRQFSVDFHN